jgi:hypothetical protein
MKLKIDQALVKLLKDESKEIEVAPVMPRYAFSINGKTMLHSFSSNYSTYDVKIGANHNFGYLFPNSKIEVLWSQID